MKHLTIIVAGAIAISGAVAFGGIAGSAQAQQGANSKHGWFIKHHKRNKTDFALFDATNPANLEPGAVCYVSSLRPSRPWKFFVSVTNNDAANTQSFQVVYKDGDWVRYYVPPRSSFSLAQAAGASTAGVAIRVFTAANSQLSGAVSAQALDGFKVTCKSCDNDADGPAACDAIIPFP